MNLSRNVLKFGLITALSVLAATTIRVDIAAQGSSRTQLKVLQVDVDLNALE